ncbi:hypothetical protein BLNAU_11962 [Blattamonas nauphoetae]|uniref:Uncharacterized protein n=1 Tax=Blattamonas nauphoetae TaxID=2049346 RepID=A0ABQ9XM98_9EUKA|nr:hypothetical protein BLNAU_11962 [Blattamonas nauphoetae]
MRLKINWKRVKTENKKLAGQSSFLSPNDPVPPPKDPLLNPTSQEDTIIAMQRSLREKEAALKILLLELSGKGSEEKRKGLAMITENKRVEEERLQSGMKGHKRERTAEINAPQDDVTVLEEVRKCRQFPAAKPNSMDININPLQDRDPPDAVIQTEHLFLCSQNVSGWIHASQPKLLQDVSTIPKKEQLKTQVVSISPPTLICFVFLQASQTALVTLDEKNIVRTFEGASKSLFASFEALCAGPITAVCLCVPINMLVVATSDGMHKQHHALIQPLPTVDTPLRTRHSSHQPHGSHPHPPHTWLYLPRWYTPRKPQSAQKADWLCQPLGRSCHWPSLLSQPNSSLLTSATDYNRMKERSNVTGGGTPHPTALPQLSFSTRSIMSSSEVLVMDMVAIEGRAEESRWKEEENRDFMREMETFLSQATKEGVAFDFSLQIAVTDNKSNIS